MVISYGVTAAVYGAMAWVRSEAMCNQRVAEQREIYREVIVDQNKRLDRLLK